MNINYFSEAIFQEHIEKLIALGTHDVELCKLAKGGEPLDFAASALETITFLIDLKKFVSSLKKELTLNRQSQQKTETTHRA